MKIILLEKTFEEICNIRGLDIRDKNKGLGKAFYIYRNDIFEGYIYIDGTDNDKCIINEYIGSWKYKEDLFDDINKAIDAYIKYSNKRIEELMKYIDSTLKNISEIELDKIQAIKIMEQYNKNNS